MADSIRIAFIGAGIFAREAHLPALQALGETYTVAAIYSRTEATAQRLANQIERPVDITTDIDALMARDDIDAVNIILPIHLMPDVIHKALDARKHIISEKPAAPDLATGRALLAHHAQHPELVWMVAENWRYEPVMVQAAAIVSDGEIGRPVLAQLDQHIAMTPDNKYYHTPWRREGAFPGGFIMDGGVHHVALLRMILGEIVAVHATARQMHPDLPPLDTLNAVLEFADGFTGSYSVTYAADSPWTQTLHIVGEEGAVLMDRESIHIICDTGERTLALPAHQGVQEELAAFADAINQGTAHRNTAREGLQDVAVIEAMLLSARTGKRATVERVPAGA